MERLRIGFFVQRAAGLPDFRNNVSAHVQIPCQTIELLRDRGHHVELVTTEHAEDLVLPDCVPSGIDVHYVPYGSRQRGSTIMHSGFKKGVSPVHLVRQLHALAALAKEQKYDLYHFCGGNGIGHLGGLLRRLGLDIPIVATLITGAFPERFGAIKNIFWSKLDATITSTKYFASQQLQSGLSSAIVRHGICRDVSSVISSRKKKCNRDRVLFWRDPDKDNGADTCALAFDQLAPKYPDISFDFAIRPHWAPVREMDVVAEKYSNVRIHRFPYPDDATIEDFLESSLCVVLPFRRLSINPQFAIMESMAMGVPTITTSIESNGELIESGRDGYLVDPGDVDSIVECVERLIVDPELASRMGEFGVKRIAEDWNWNRYADDLEGIYVGVLGRS